MIELRFDRLFEGMFEGRLDGMFHITSDATFDGILDATFDGTLAATFDGLFDAMLSRLHQPTLDERSDRTLDRAFGMFHQVPPPYRLSVVDRALIVEYFTDMSIVETGFNANFSVWLTNPPQPECGPYSTPHLGMQLVLHVPLGSF